MSTVRILSHHQITLPAAIINSAGLHENDVLEANYKDGVIMLIPKSHSSKQDDIMSYAGIARHVYGNTVKEIDDFVNQISN